MAEESGIVLESPVMGDLERVSGLIRACEEADQGEAESTVGDLRGVWNGTTFDLSRDTWLVRRADGEPIGYGHVRSREEGRRFEGFGYTHPGERGNGIGTKLVRAMESRAREGSGPAVLGTVINHTNDGARGLLADHGFEEMRNYWQMRIDLGGGVPAPEWPDGVTVRTFRAGADEEAIHTLVQETFAESFGFVATPFEEWTHTMMGVESFDPRLWFVATSGEEIVGAALCPDYEDEGWVRQLAVRREWRRRGVGTALLRHAFAEFGLRGRTRTGLVVDSYNRTGARAVYEEVGMRVHRQYDGWDKELVVSSQ